MKTSILAAVTLDGFIAHGTHDEEIDWTSAADKKWVKKLTTQAGAVVMGHNTFETFKQPLSERYNIVLTHHPQQQPSQPNTWFTDQDPNQILRQLDAEGYKEAVIFGGSQIFRLFLEAHRVDYLYLTLAPMIFGQGIAFPYESIPTSARLISLMQLSKKETVYKLAL